MRIIGLLPIAGMLALPVPTAAPAACHFAAQRVVGCFPDNSAVAALAFQRFKANQAALEDPSVKEVLASRSCRVIVSAPEHPFRIFRRGHGEIATLNGYEPVSIVEFKTSEGQQIFSVASKWISGACEEAPPAPSGCTLGDPCNPYYPSSGKP